RPVRKRRACARVAPHGRGPHGRRVHQAGCHLRLRPAPGRHVPHLGRRANEARRQPRRTAPIRPGHRSAGGSPTPSASSAIAQSAIVHRATLPLDCDQRWGTGGEASADGGLPTPLLLNAIVLPGPVMLLAVLLPVAAAAAVAMLMSHPSHLPCSLGVLRFHPVSLYGFR